VALSYDDSTINIIVVIIIIIMLSIPSLSYFCSASRLSNFLPARICGAIYIHPEVFILLQNSFMSANAAAAVVELKLSTCKTVVMCKIKYLQRCCKMFQCFILHVTTSKNIFKIFYAKTFATLYF